MVTAAFSNSTLYGIMTPVIPQFPEFKKFILTDKPDIEKLIGNFPPYSDFNPMSMWSWDLDGELLISQYSGNLVVRFNDYLTGDPFYSFIGANNIDETAKLLLELSEKAAYCKQLKLIPEDVALHLDRETFIVEEDRDNFDYILSIDRLLPHDGSERKLSSRRRLINKIKSLSNFYVRAIDIRQSDIIKQILDVSITWETQRGITESEASRLHQALKKAMHYSHSQDVFCLGAFIENKLVGYSMNEVVGGGYAVGNFQQADLAVSDGIYALLMQEAAVYLGALGCSYINLEQDLGISGLRKWKSSYGPVGYLKKYTVVLR